MSKNATAAGSPVGTGATLSSLAALARRGAVAELHVTMDNVRVIEILVPASLVPANSVPAGRPDAGGTVRLVRRGRLAYPLFRDACDAGWLVPSDRNALRFVLSPAARHLLRRLKSQSDPVAAAVPPDAGAPGPSKRSKRRKAGSDVSGVNPPPARPPVPLPPLPAPRIDAAESPLSWMRRHKDRSGEPLISPMQFEAGERLRADLWRAGMSPRLTINWDRIGDGGVGSAPARSSQFDGDRSEAASSAGERVRRALTAVGTVSAGLLIDVCGHLTGLEEIERRRGWPVRSGKVALQIALSELARHYRLPGAVSDATIEARLRAWHAA